MKKKLRLPLIRAEIVYLTVAAEKDPSAQATKIEEVDKEKLQADQDNDISNDKKEPVAQQVPDIKTKEVLGRWGKRQVYEINGKTFNNEVDAQKYQEELKSQPNVVNGKAIVKTGDGKEHQVDPAYITKNAGDGWVNFKRNDIKVEYQTNDGKTMSGHIDNAYLPAAPTLSPTLTPTPSPTPQPTATQEPTTSQAVTPSANPTVAVTSAASPSPTPIPTPSTVTNSTSAVPEIVEGTEAASPAANSLPTSAALTLAQQPTKEQTGFFNWAGANPQATYNSKGELLYVRAVGTDGKKQDIFVGFKGEEPDIIYEPLVGGNGYNKETVEDYFTRPVS